MSPGNVFEVRVNRLLLLGITAVGTVFLLAGLDGLFFRTVLDWSELETAKKWLWYAFLFFFIVCGGLVTLQSAWSFLFPPLMLRFGPEGVTFGTGFRYTPRTLAWQHVKSIGYGVDRTLTVLAQLQAGARVSFKEHPDVPPSLATSAGIGYSFNSLTLSWLYVNKLSWTIVSEGRRIAKLNGVNAG